MQRGGGNLLMGKFPPEVSEQEEFPSLNMTDVHTSAAQKH